MLSAFIRGAIGDNKSAQTVVLCLALFRKFGFATPVSVERDFIYEHVVKKLDGAISLVDYNRTIRKLRDSRILQGSSTLYFTPRLLHIWLWSQWWTIGDHGTYLAIWEALQGQTALKEWFADMLAYAHESQDVVAAIRTLFGPDGSLHTFPEVPGTGAASLFLHAARIAPSEALTVLERNLGRRTIDELRAFEAGRHETVHALRVIAQDARLFDRAARLLLRLAEAENQAYSNNATGMFKNLFRLGYGDAASSQLEPKARLPLLLEIAGSRNPVHRGLALQAFEAALETSGSFVASIVNHPLQRAANLWTPRTWGEVFDALVAYWDALVSLLPEIAPNERGEWTDVVLTRLRRLVRQEAISEQVVDRLEWALNRNTVPRDGALRAIDDVLHDPGTKLDDRAARRLRKLREDLVGADFEVRLRCFVGAGRQAVEGEAANQDMLGFESVVAETVAQPSLLHPLLPWIVSADLGSGFEFGRRLAIEDLDLSVFWPPIRQILAKSHLTIIGPFPRGYFTGVFGRDPVCWELLLQQLIQDSLPRSTITALAVDTGMTKSIAVLLCEWLEKEEIDAQTLTRLALSTPASRLPSDLLRRCLDSLLHRTDLAAAVAALETVHFTLQGDPAAFDDELLGRILLNPPLFSLSQGDQRLIPSLAFWWARHAARWADDDADRLGLLAEALLRSFRNDDGVFRRDDESLRLLRQAFRAAPSRAWSLVGPLLASGDRPLSYRLSIWLRGEDWFGREGTDEAPPTDLLPQELILTWVEDDPGQRAPLAAEIAPPVREASEWPSSLARRLLIRYGDRRDVQSALDAGYFTESWPGPASLHYRGRQNQIKLMWQSETEPRPREWLATVDLQLSDFIERAEIEEERRY